MTAMAIETEQSRARERLIEAATDLFYKQGFHATGLDQILARAGTSKTTFYKHFETKDDLALLCIKFKDARWRERFPALLAERAGDDPVGQLREVFRLWRDWFSDIHFNGCLFIHACSEFPSPTDPCHIAASGNIDALRDIIADLADRAGFREPKRFADRYKLLMEGAIILEVIDRKNESASTAGEIAEVVIECELSRLEES